MFVHRFWVQRDAEQLRQPHVQGADGVVAEVGLLEKRNAKGDDDDAATMPTTRRQSVCAMRCRS